jgi:hypothetical protein
MDEQRSGEQRWYRVEHRDGDETKPLGEIADAPHHRSALDPWASRLRREGGTGQLVLVDKGTEELVACQDLETPPRWHGHTNQRPLNPAIALIAKRAGEKKIRRTVRLRHDDPA